MPSSGSEQAETEESPEEHLDKLRTDLEEAVSAEDYQGAAGLRDQIKELEGSNPVRSLKAQLQAAVEAQDYPEAIRCRDELQKLSPVPKSKIPSTPPPPTKSETITNGIRIQVKSSFLPHRSRPGQYVFMYQVRIENQVPDTVVKLHSRHWVITDANNFQDQVRGEGVLGEQPEIDPNKEYAYSSSVPIRTPTGKMSGTYQMQVKDSNGQWKHAFDASIGVFGLSMSDATPL